MLSDHSSGEHDMFKEFFYITRVGNLDSIIKHGILSRTYVDEAGGADFDISNHSVQEWRRNAEPIFNRPINSYTPLYINPRNPMLLCVQKQHSDLVILGVSSDVLSSNQHLFSDGNAACRNTQFSTDPDILVASFPALNAKYWTDIADGKRKRMAEVLIFPEIEAKYLTRVFCQSADLARTVSHQHGIETIANSSFFF